MGTNPSNLFTVKVAPGATAYTSSPTYDDITSLVSAITISSGRSVPFGPFQARTATIEADVSAGDLNGFNDSDWAPNIPLVVEVTADSTDYRRFTGTVDADSIVPRHPEAAVTSFTASDLTKFVDRETNLGLGSVPAERADDRFARVLDALGVPSGLRDIDLASRTMVATNLDIDARTALDTIVRTLGPMSAWFVDRDGNVRLDGRHCYASRSRIASSTAAFSTNGLLQILGAHRFDQPRLVSATEQHLFTAARVTNANGVSATATVGAAPYLRYPDTTIESLSDPQGDADLIVALFGTPLRYMRSIVVEPAGDDATLEMLADLELRDRVSIHYEPVDGGGDISQTCTVERITETIAAGRLYRATLGLYPTSAVDALGPSDWARVGTAQVGTAKVAP